MLYEPLHFETLNNHVINALFLTPQSAPIENECLSDPYFMLGYLVRYHLGDIDDTELITICRELRELPYFEYLENLLIDVI